MGLKVFNPLFVGRKERGRSQPHSPGWARLPLNFFLKFRLIFPKTLLFFFLILVLRVGESPTREGPGYATGKEIVKKIQL